MAPRLRKTPLRLLWLHDLGDPRTVRRAVWALETLLERTASGHIVVSHDARVAAPKLLRESSWDGVFLGPTVLCSRYDRIRLDSLMKRFGWIAESGAPIFALPQDDYDCSAILDGWLVKWGAKVAWSVVSGFSHVTLPRFLAGGGQVKAGFTNYIESTDIGDVAGWVPLGDRTWDVTYRTAVLPANFGRVGWEKSAVPAEFLERCLRRKTGLRLDISTRPADLILGKAWMEFLTQSRTCLAMPSGSSLLDPWGDHRRRVARFSQAHPRASFEETRDVCFPGQDEIYRMTALSPRNIEAVLAGVVQVAPEDDYGGVLTRDADYIGLEPDLSNLDDVIESVKDDSNLTKIAAHARESVLARKDLRAEAAVAAWIQAADEHSSHTRHGQSRICDRDTAMKYNAWVRQRSRQYWRAKSLEWVAKAQLKATANRVSTWKR